MDRAVEAGVSGGLRGTEAGHIISGRSRASRWVAGKRQRLSGSVMLQEC